MRWPFSTKGAREFDQALTAVGRFGVPRYTTALLPSATNNVGALVYDTTTGGLKVSNGTTYQTGVAAGDALTVASLSVTGAASAASVSASGANLTAGTMAVENNGLLRTAVSSFTWTNAQVVALGAALTGDIVVATLPAKTVVLNAYVVITGTAAGVATLSVALGRTGAAFIDYIVASDAKVAANTVYGDASAERGTNLTGYDLPSYTGTTAVSAHFISTVQNLDQTTGSTGRVILFTALVP